MGKRPYQHKNSWFVQFFFIQNPEYFISNKIVKEVEFLLKVDDSDACY